PRSRRPPPRPGHKTPRRPASPSPARAALPLPSPPRDEFGRQRFRLAATSALHPAAVVVRDESCELDSVVKRRNRSGAAATNREDATPLGFDATPGRPSPSTPPRSPPPP